MNVFKSSFHIIAALATAVLLLNGCALVPLTASTLPAANYAASNSDMEKDNVRLIKAEPCATSAHRLVRVIATADGEARQAIKASGKFNEVIQAQNRTEAKGADLFVTIERHDPVFINNLFEKGLGDKDRHFGYEYKVTIVGYDPKTGKELYFQEGFIRKLVTGMPTADEKTALGNMFAQDMAKHLGQGNLHILANKGRSAKP